MNIELHGFENPKTTYSGSVYELREVIWKKLGEIAKPGVVKGTVIKIVPGSSEDYREHECLFFRIFSDRLEHFAIAVRTLKRIEVLKHHKPPISVECVLLNEYHEL